MPRWSPFTYATGLGLWGLYHRGTLERLPGPESLGGWAFWEVSLSVGAGVGVGLLHEYGGWAKILRTMMWNH